MKNIKLSIPVKFKIENKVYDVTYTRPKKKQIKNIFGDSYKKLEKEALELSNKAKLYKNQYEEAIAIGNKEDYERYYSEYEELNKKADKLYKELDKIEEETTKKIFYSQIDGKDKDELYEIAREYDLFDEIFKEIRELAQKSKKNNR